MHPKDRPVTLAERLQGLSLYLVGMMGCGKSHVGPALADRLGYRFVDLDSVISAAANCQARSKTGTCTFRKSVLATGTRYNDILKNVIMRAAELL